MWFKWRIVFPGKVRVINKAILRWFYDEKKLGENIYVDKAGKGTTTDY